LTALGSTNHDVHWLRLRKADIVQEERPIPENIQVVNWRKSGRKPTWLEYSRLSRDFRNAVLAINPDIIHAGPIQRVALLPALSGCHPLLSMSWGFDMLEDADRNNLWKWITYFVLKHSDWLAADCETVKRKAKRFNFPEEKVTVFPWGVDLTQFSPEKQGFMRRQVGFEEDFLIVHTRSWEPRYGVDIALKGFRIAQKQVPNLRMFMLGGGSHENQVKLFVEENKLTDRIQFCGYKKNQSLVDYYQAADAYLSASHIDGSSVALMEAMACGCPPIVSDIPSNLEWVEHEKEGWVFKDNDAYGLAEQILDAASNREEIQKRGKNARNKAEEKANWTLNFQRLLETYDTVVKSARKNAR